MIPEHLVGKGISKSTLSAWMTIIASNSNYIMFTVSACLFIHTFIVTSIKMYQVYQMIIIQWWWISFSIQPLPAQLSFPLARIDPFLTDRLTSPQGRCRNGLELWNPKNPRKNMVCHDVSCWKPLETAFFVDWKHLRYVEVFPVA